MRTLAIATLTVLLSAVAAGSAATSKFAVTSNDIAPGQKLSSAQVFNGFGCNGKNISPALVWKGAPAATKSFALTMYDPDAPTGSGWWHWVVINIPAATNSLAANAGDPKSGLMPAGALQANTDFGGPGYGGACPPAGSAPHRYIIRLHALKVAHLEVPANASAALIGFNIYANTIATAKLTGLYSR